MRNRKSANPNAIGPTGVKRTFNSSADKTQGLRLENSGLGPIVSDVEYDAENRLITVTRTSTTDIHTRESLRRGIVQHPISSVAVGKGTTIIGPEEWFPLTGNKKSIDITKSPLLQDDFQHGDGFGDSQPWVNKLPVGMAWVRLAEGSSPVGGAAADADYDDYSDRVITPKIGEGYGKGPNLVACTVEAGRVDNDPDKEIDTSVPTVIVLWFDQPLDDDLHYTFRRWRLIRVKSSGANIKLVRNTLRVHPLFPSALQFTVDRAVGLDEDVYVKVNKGVTKNLDGMGNRTSTLVSCNIRADKNCYVLCYFPHSSIETTKVLTEGATVLLGQPAHVLDDPPDSNGKPVDKTPYTVHAMTQAGSDAGSVESFGVIWGGQFGSVSTGRVQIRYRNLTEWSLKGFVPVSIIADWDNIALPDDWTPADELVTATPAGVGYVRLLPFSNDIGGGTWEDDGFIAKPLPIDEPPTIIEAKIVGRIKLYVTWSQPVVVPGSDPIMTASGGALIASNFSIEYDNIISYDLDRNVAATETVSLSGVAGWVEAVHDSQYASAAVIASVRNINVRSSMVLVAHRIMPTTLYRGQIVRLKDNGFVAFDDAGNPQSLIDIMPSTDIMPEHHHSGDTDGGYAISHAWSGG